MAQLLDNVLDQVLEHGDIDVGFLPEELRGPTAAMIRVARDTREANRTAMNDQQRKDNIRAALGDTIGIFGPALAALADDDTRRPIEAILGATRSIGSADEVGDRDGKERGLLELLRAGSTLFGQVGTIAPDADRPLVVRHFIFSAGQEPDLEMFRTWMQESAKLLVAAEGGILASTRPVESLMKVGMTCYSTILTILLDCNEGNISGATARAHMHAWFGEALSSGFSVIHESTHASTKERIERRRRWIAENEA